MFSQIVEQAFSTQTQKSKRHNYRRAQRYNYAEEGFKDFMLGLFKKKEKKVEDKRSAIRKYIDDVYPAKIERIKSITNPNTQEVKFRAIDASFFFDVKCDINKYEALVNEILRMQEVSKNFYSDLARIFYSKIKVNDGFQEDEIIELYNTLSKESFSLITKAFSGYQKDKHKGSDIYVDPKTSVFFVYPHKNVGTHSITSIENICEMPLGPYILQKDDRHATEELITANIDARFIKTAIQIAEKLNLALQKDEENEESFKAPDNMIYNSISSLQGWIYDDNVDEDSDLYHAVYCMVEDVVQGVLNDMHLMCTVWAKHLLQQLMFVLDKYEVPSTK